MKLRKTNAVFSLLATMLIFGHAISIGIWMLSQGRTHRMPHSVSFVLLLVFVIHAVLSIILMATSHKGAPKNKGNIYPKLNAPTLVQRISGVLLIIFTWLHIAGAIGIMQPPKAVHAIVPPLFFTLVMAHVAISVSKAFITLGIGNAKFVKRADIAIKLVCAVVLVADIVGFYLFVC